MNDRWRPNWNSSNLVHNLFSWFLFRRNLFFFFFHIFIVCFFLFEHFDRKWVTINQLINESIGNIAWVGIKRKRLQNIYLVCIFLSMAHILFKCKLIKTIFGWKPRQTKIRYTSVFVECLPVHKSNAKMFAQGNSNISVATVKAEYRIHWRTATAELKMSLKAYVAVQCDRQTQISKPPLFVIFLSSLYSQNNH